MDLVVGLCQAPSPIPGWCGRWPPSSCAMPCQAGPRSDPCCLQVVPHCRPTCLTLSPIQPEQCGGRGQACCPLWSSRGVTHFRHSCWLQDFPSACFVPCQGPEHPNPGKKFTARGFPRHCYLPDNEKGRKVSDLLPAPPGASPALERCPEEGRAFDSNQGAVP